MNTQVKNIIETTLKFSEYHYFMLSGGVGELSEFFRTHYHWDGIVLKDCVELSKQFEEVNLPSTIALLELVNNPQFVNNLTTPVMKEVNHYPINILFIYSNVPFDEDGKAALATKQFTKINTSEGELYINDNFIQFYA